MKKLFLPLGLICVFALAACGSSQSSAPASSNNSKTTSQTEHSKKNTTSKSDASKKTTTSKPDSSKTNAVKQQSPNKDIPIGATEKSEIGVQTVVARQKGLNDTYTTGPFKLTIEGYQVSTLKPSADVKPMFNNKDQTTIIALKMKVENTSSKDLDFYPAQATITTNTGAQAQAKTFISGDVGGTFYGKVHKEGEVFFQVADPAKKINEVTFIVPGPNDDKSLSTVGKDLKIKIPIKQ